VYVVSVAARMKTTGDGDSWKRRCFGCNRKDAVAYHERELGSISSQLLEKNTSRKDKVNIVIRQKKQKRLVVNYSQDKRLHWFG